MDTAHQIELPCRYQNRAAMLLCNDTRRWLSHLEEEVVMEDPTFCQRNAHNCSHAATTHVEASCDTRGSSRVFIRRLLRESGTPRVLYRADRIETHRGNLWTQDRRFLKAN